MSDDLISREELLKAIDTWDKFGYSARYGLERLDKDDRGYVPYIHYDDVIKCIKGMPSVKPQEPKTARWTVGHDEQGEIIACGNCGRVFPAMEPYCGNCGRRMLKPVKEEEA